MVTDMISVKMVENVEVCVPRIAYKGSNRRYDVSWYDLNAKKT